MGIGQNVRIHPTAEVSPEAIVGDRSQVWNQSQVRPGSVLGHDCILGKDVYIDAGVKIGNNVKIQNGVSVYHGVTIEDGVFCGPHCVFTNDRVPRAINPDGTLKSASDWKVSETLIKYGAAIGANSTIACGVTIGRWALIGAGAVVTRDVPDYGMAYGNPARVRGFVCACGTKLKITSSDATSVAMKCGECGTEVTIAAVDYVALTRNG